MKKKIIAAVKAQFASKVKHKQLVGEDGETVSQFWERHIKAGRLDAADKDKYDVSDPLIEDTTTVESSDPNSVEVRLKVIEDKLNKLLNLMDTSKPEPQMKPAVTDKIENIDKGDKEVDEVVPVQ